jgi:hypothetical protein
MRFGFPCEVGCRSYRKRRKRVNIFLNFPEISLKRLKPRMTRMASLGERNGDTKMVLSIRPFTDSPTPGITGFRRPLVTMLLLFRKRCDEKQRSANHADRREVFSFCLRPSISLSRNSCDSRADLTANRESDARTHRTPKALRAKSTRSVSSPRTRDCPIGDQSLITSH